MISKKSVDLAGWKFDGRVSSFVHSVHFETAIAVLVILNSALVGWETDHAARNHGVTPEAVKYAEIWFCVIFVCELLLRLCADGLEFFTIGGVWNVFDAVLVVFQLLDQLNLYVFKMLQALRLFRSLRIMRALRLVHLFHDLRNIVLSISTTLSSLVWAMVLLVVNVYVFSVFFLQLVVDSGELWRQDELRYWFDGLGRTALTLYECIVGGVSWDEVVEQMMRNVGSSIAVVFCFYIGMSVFALMNLVTGLFVDRVAVVVRMDKDNTLADGIEDMFGEFGDDDLISEGAFVKAFESNAMLPFFNAIDVDPSEIKKLYDLIDTEAKGKVEKKDILNFCRRLLGPTKVLDTAILMEKIVLILSILEYGRDT